MEIPEVSLWSLNIDFYNFLLVSKLTISMSLFNIGDMKICSEDQVEEEGEYSSNDLHALANAGITDVVDEGDKRLS